MLEYIAIIMVVAIVLTIINKRPKYIILRAPTEQTKTSTKLRFRNALVTDQTELVKPTPKTSPETRISMVPYDFSYLLSETKNLPENQTARIILEDKVFGTLARATLSPKDSKWIFCLEDDPRISTKITEFPELTITLRFALSNSKGQDLKVFGGRRHVGRAGIYRRGHDGTMVKLT